jgi:DNA repair protein RadA/Sms
MTQSPFIPESIELRPCSECGIGFDVSKFLCPHCRAWNLEPTEDEAEFLDRRDDDSTFAGLEMTPLSEIEGTDGQRVETGPWDSCFGGGIVTTSNTILAGDPGSGKSTIVLQILDALLTAEFDRAVYVYAEGDASTVRDYSARLKLRNVPRILIPEVHRASDLILWFENSEDRYPVALDSVSAMAKNGPQSIAIAKAAKDYAARVGAPVFLLCHVNKEGDVAGVKALEHWVDTIVMFKIVRKGKEPTRERKLMVEKNRFGPNLTLALQTCETGLEAVPPSQPTSGKRK